MKVIDLLNKIANGEKVPSSIIYKGHCYYNVGDEEQAYYENTELDDNLFLYAVYNESHLNDEIEIIEDTPKEKQIPDKITIETDATNMEYITGKSYGKNYSKSAIEMAYRINAIIDYLKSKGE